MKTKTNNEIDDMIKDYIEDYIEDDNDCMVPSDVVYATDVNSNLNPSDYSDLLDDTLDIIDISNIGNITLSDPSQIVDIPQSDITLKVDGKDRKVSELFNAIDAIEKRLGILKPDPKLLDKYELLQSLHQQYTAAEAMLYGDDNEEEDSTF